MIKEYGKDTDMSNKKRIHLKKLKNHFRRRKYISEDGVILLPSGGFFSICPYGLTHGFSNF
jgi:hypothetical protein